jgi:hypothetical protein
MVASTDERAAQHLRSRATLRPGFERGLNRQKRFLLTGIERVAYDHVDLGQTAGRPVAILGDVWVGISDNGGDTVLVDPRTLLVHEDMSCCPGAVGLVGTVGADSAGAFGSVWGYDVGDGEVQRWDPPNLSHVIQVTDAPFYDGSCMTSIAATGDAVWGTLAPAIDYACKF